MAGGDFLALVVGILLATEGRHPVDLLSQLPAATLSAEARQLRTELPVLNAAQQKARASELQRALPSALHASLEVDWSGMNELLTLELASPLAPGDVPGAILALLRAYPSLFGVHAPEKLRPYNFDATGGASGYFGEGERYAGLVEVLVEKHRKVSVRGHLWPVSTEAVSVPLKKLVGEYLGQEVTYPSRQLGRNTESTTLDEDHFSLQAGPALVCAHGKARVVQAAYVSLGLAGHPLPEFPALFDAQTHQRIPEDYVVPTLNEGPPVLSTHVAESSHAHRCFFPDQAK